MRKAAIISAFAHALVFALVYFGVPSLFRPKTVEDTPVAVEIVSLEPDAAPKPAPAPPPKPEAKPEPPKPPPPPPPPKAETPPPPTPPEPRPPEPKPPEPKPAAETPPPEPEPAPLPKEKPAPKPEPPKPEAKPEPPKAAPPAPVPKRKPQAPPDQFQTLLRNLAKQKDQQQKTKATEKTDKKAPAKQPEPFDVQSLVASLQTPQRSEMDRRRLSSSLSSLVKQQVTPCWSIPGGAKEVHDMKIAVRIQLNPDGTLRGTPRLEDTARLQSDPFYRAVAESALRALRNPRCTPLKLPQDQYDIWKDITFLFEPGEALGP